MRQTLQTEERELADLVDGFRGLKADRLGSSILALCNEMIKERRNSGCQDGGGER